LRIAADLKHPFNDSMRRELEKKEREERRTKEGARTSSENGIIGNKKGSRHKYTAREFRGYTA